MKRTIRVVLAGVLALTMCAFAVGCSLGGDSGGGETPGEATVYTIQYNFNGLQTINVKSGDVYTLAELPAKTGYVFSGLYDAEEGGTKYVDAQGMSVSAFTDNKNIVLYPQFVPETYTVVFDFGAAAPGSSQRSVEVEYGGKLTFVPKGLTADHKIFNGWYTAPDCGGTQIADAYDILPQRSIVNETNFGSPDKDGFLYLYAGFKAELFTVTFYADPDSAESEEVDVEYGTPIADVVPTTRVNGNAVLSWSKSKNDTEKKNIFTGKITDSIVLYAAEYAPVLELDTDGGDYVKPVVAKAGAAISLPKAEKKNYKFMGWTTSDGDVYEDDVMPSTSINLKASWQAMLVFDVNGGTEVKDISEPRGTAITLPSPEKEDYIFAGWYTEDKEAYSKTVMPNVSVELKAGWYKTQNVTKIILKDSNSSDDWVVGGKRYPAGVDGPRANWRKEIDLSDYISINGASIQITLKYDMATNYADAIYEGGFYLYDGPIVSDSSFLCKNINSVISTSWKTFELNTKLKMRGGTLYLCYYAYKTNSTNNVSSLFFKNIYIDIEYPDTSTLIL